MPAIGVLPPFLMFAAVLAIAPVAGIPPKHADAMLPKPWATSSALGLCFEPIMESATTAERSDSTPARNAMVTAFESCPLMFSKVNIVKSTLNGGRPAGMSANCLPIVLTSRWNTSTITAVTMTAIKEPGIFLKKMGHTMRMTRAIAPIITACQLSVTAFFMRAITFSPVSMGFSPFW